MPHARGTATVTSLLRTVPNLITLARLVMVPIVIALIIDERWEAAFLVFVVAGVSDAVDGFLARAFDLRTLIGAYLDPVADKALLVSIYVALAVAKVLPASLAVLVVSRDVMIVGAVLIAWVIDRPVEIKPLLLSKLNTTAQIALAAGVLGAKAFGMTLGGWLLPAVALVAALTIASAAAYLIPWLRHVHHGD